MATRHEVEIGGERVQIATAGELAIALDVLHGKHDRMVLEQLRDHLGEIIDSPPALATAFKSLTPEDQLFLIEVLGSDLGGILEESRYLRDILANIAVIEVEVKMLEAIGGPGLRKLIQTAEELAEVLEWVYGECDDLLVDLLGWNHLTKIFKNAYELSVVLASMGRNNQARFLDELGWDKVMGSVRDGRDLAYLLRALPADRSMELLERYDAGELRDLIGNRSDWRYLWARLEPGEASYLTEKLGVSGDAA